MEKLRKGLGKFLLKGFRNAGHKKPLRKERLKRAHFSLRLSQMQPQMPVPVEVAEFPDPASVSKPAPQIESVIPVETELDTLSVVSDVTDGVNTNEVKLPAEIPVKAAPPALNEYEYRSLSTQDIVRPNDPLRQSIEGFLADLRSIHTRKAYGKDLKRFVKFLHGRSVQNGFEGLNRTILIAYKESLITEGLEHTTIDRHLATLRSFFKWLVDDGHLSRSPAEGVRFLNPKRVSRTIGFSDEEVKKILSLPDLHTRTGAQHYAILMILFYCGLRRSELCSLRTTYISTERNQRILRLRGKGNAERIIVMIPPVWNAISYYSYITQRDLKKDEFLFLPLRNNRTGDLNKALDSSMIFYIVTRYSRLAGIANRVSPHSCRATAISNARDHNVPDRAIQEFAGWASPDMITRYDKRKTSIENSAAHSISYGADVRLTPEPPEVSIFESKTLDPK